MKAPARLSLHFDARRRSFFTGAQGAAVLLLLLAAPGAHAQIGGADQADPPSARQPGMPENSQELSRQQRSMLERRNEAREKELEADTHKLLELAQSLNADVAKTNKNELSLDVMKRAEQIEKLARSIRDKMRGYY